MKLERYFAPLVCPWCRLPMGTVNTPQKASVLSATPCASCYRQLYEIEDHVTLIIDDLWLSDIIQDAEVPIYPFVCGLLLSSQQPPSSVPHWEDRFAILPLSIASQMGFPLETVEALKQADTPILISFEDPKTTRRFSPMMRPGSC